MSPTLAHAIPILEESFKAHVAMTTKYIAVKMGADEGEVDIAGDGETAIGILQTTAATADDMVRVMISGISPVKAFGAFSAGDLLNSGGAAGRVDTAAAAEDGIAIALKAATAQDDEVPAIVGIHKYIAAS